MIDEMLCMMALREKVSGGEGFDARTEPNTQQCSAYWNKDPRLHRTVSKIYSLVSRLGMI